MLSHGSGERGNVTGKWYSFSAPVNSPIAFFFRVFKALSIRAECIHLWLPLKVSGRCNPIPDTVESSVQCWDLNKEMIKVSCRGSRCWSLRRVKRKLGTLCLTPGQGASSYLIRVGFMRRGGTEQGFKFNSLWLAVECWEFTSTRRKQLPIWNAVAPVHRNEQGARGFSTRPMSQRLWVDLFPVSSFTQFL